MFATLFQLDRAARLSLAAAAMTLVAGCGAADRIADIGKPPDLSAIENPQLRPEYQPVSLPMPAPRPTRGNPNSLWDPNRRSFFKDQRAGDIGDILTVVIEIDDRAELENETERTRTNSEGADIPAFLGYETQLPKFLPDELQADNLVELGSNSSSAGSGTVDRAETIELRLAAIITQVLPNGNLVLVGRQEVRVNFERRDLYVAGVIRPEDIRSDNTIPYDQIAEARIAYGGKGQITDVQQPRYGQQLFDIIMPF